MTATSKLIPFLILLVLLLIEILCDNTYTPISSTLEAQLNKEERKAECCSKNMRCCKKHPPPPNVEIRAVIARCIDPPNVCTRNRNIKKTLNRNNMNNLQKFQGFDEDEPLIQSEVTKCAKKLILTIKMKNEGGTNTQNQFVVIDHVYDPLTDKTVRLLNPYVIKMRHEHLSQAYGLRFVDYVNSQAKEQVYNKHDGNYTGCNVDDKKPTCGLVTYQGKIVPYSSGFCCSCDAKQNMERQHGRESSHVIAYSDPAYLLDSVECPRTQLKDKDELEKKTGEESQKSQRQNKETQKRNMDHNNIYYIRHQKGFKIPKQTTEKVHRENKRIDDNFNIESNYKIQSMNDAYEDQLANKVNFADKFNNLKSQTKKLGHLTNKQTPKNAKKEATTKRKEFIKKDFDKNFGTTKKPSMHELLHSSRIVSPSGKVYNFDKDIQRIADQAFQDAIKRDENKNKKDAKRKVRNLQQDVDCKYSRKFNKRQVQSSGVQRRGGQNCADRYTPPHLDPESYHESTHCLRFSPIWYGVYRLEKPLVEQEIVFQIFEKYETEAGAVQWKDLTKGKKVKLGTFWPFYKDEVPTISMSFSSVFDDEEFCLDWNKLRLLIPEGVDQAHLGKYPEARGGPTEYLMVPAQKIVMTGDQCDVAGVGFEAFFRQPNRCSMPRSTCLKHQPFHLWHYDKRMERSGKKGCFFLKHHGKLAKNPIRKNTTNGEKFLTFNYYGRTVSLVDMEINADFNAVLRPTSAAVITEVYIDSSCSSSTLIVVKVSNAGLLSSKFMVRLCDCPLDLQGKLNDVQSELALIPPQHQHIFHLAFHTSIQADLFHCSVEALNAEGELVALRRIKIQKLDRCICTWHCLCACTASSTGLKCIPMKVDHYHAAGFKGGLPIVTYVQHETIVSDIYRLIMFIVLFISFTLFILGLTKAILGLCCLPIGMWGLNIVLDLPKPMNKYYEKRLVNRDIQYDKDGWPVHPETGEKVRNIPLSTAFCTNILFFYTYPTVVFILLLKKICCPFYTYEKQRKKELDQTSKKGKKDKKVKKTKEEKQQEKERKKAQKEVDKARKELDKFTKKAIKGSEKTETKCAKLKNSCIEDPICFLAPCLPKKKDKSEDEDGKTTTTTIISFPRKGKNHKEVPAQEEPSSVSETTEDISSEAAKRRRGRCRKKPPSTTSADSSAKSNTSKDSTSGKSKKSKKSSKTSTKSSTDSKSKKKKKKDKDTKNDSDSSKKKKKKKVKDKDTKDDSDSSKKKKNDKDSDKKDAKKQKKGKKNSDKSDKSDSASTKSKVKKKKSKSKEKLANESAIIPGDKKKLSEKSDSASTQPIKKKSIIKPSSDSVAGTPTAEGISLKKKPTIKIAIMQHDRGDPYSSSPGLMIPPRDTSSIEISDNPYYFSTDDDETTYISSTDSGR